MSDNGNVPGMQTAPACCTASTMLGAVATSFAFCFVLMVIFLYARYLVIQRRRRLQAGVPQEEPKRGLDPIVIAQLPSFTYRKELSGECNTAEPSTESDSTPECSICISAIEEGEQVRLLPNCRHLFHKECIDMWLSTNGSCPVCRADLEPKHSEYSESFPCRRVLIDMSVEGVSSPVSTNDDLSGEIQRIVSRRSELRHSNEDHATRDLERQC